MRLRATVLIPTFDHGPTLLRSLPSALAQTVSELEVFVVGDGVPDVTRDVMATLMRDDERVRFFDNPKGPGNGEIHRAAALQEASGSIVCYLSDDDLWTPDHVEVMEQLLDGADFAHTLPIRFEADGELAHWTVDLSETWFRERMLAGTNFVPLGCGGHSMDLYRRLPHGWRTKPEGVWSDLYMWQQILSVRGVRSRSGRRPTVLHFPSSLRRGWTPERRLAELDAWVARLAEPGWRADLDAAVLSSVAREAAAAQREVAVSAAEREELRAVAAHLSGVRLWTKELLAQIDEGRAERMELKAQVEALRTRLADLQGRLRSTESTRTWRLRNRVLRSPLLGPLARAVGRAGARRGGR